METFFAFYPKIYPSVPSVTVPLYTIIQASQSIINKKYYDFMTLLGCFL